jgi:hypothetical protein
VEDITNQLNTDIEEEQENEDAHQVARPSAEKTKTREKSTALKTPCK